MLQISLEYQCWLLFTSIRKCVPFFDRNRQNNVDTITAEHRLRLNRLILDFILLFQFLYIIENKGIVYVKQIMVAVHYFLLQRSCYNSVMYIVTLMLNDLPVLTGFDKGMKYKPSSHCYRHLFPLAENIIIIPLFLKKWTYYNDVINHYICEQEMSNFTKSKKVPG